MSLLLVLLLAGPAFASSSRSRGKLPAAQPIPGLPRVELPSLPAVMPAAPTPVSPIQAAAQLAAQEPGSVEPASAAAFDGMAKLEAGELAALPLDGPKAPGMTAALEASRAMSVGAVQELGFRPSPASLRALARFEAYEAVLARRREGGWILVRGHYKGVSIPDVESLDVVVHNHFYHPVHQKSFSPYPSEADLMTSAGTRARWYVVSESGVVEWSTDIPYYPGRKAKPGEPVRLFQKGDDREAWRGRLMFGTIGRKAAQLFLPAFHGAFLKASGIVLRRWSWRDVTQDLIERRP